MPDRLERDAIRLLLVCMLLLGSLLAIRTPPMAGFDEPFHWRRAVQLSESRPLAARLGSNDWGGPIDAASLAFEAAADQAVATGRPLSVAAMAMLSGRLARGAPVRVPSSFPSTASFSPVAYVPAAIGVAVARAARLGPLRQMQAGRLSTLACALLMVWAVAALLPVARLSAAMLLTGPTMLHLASSFSADPVANLLPALLLAGCLRLHFAPERLPPRGWQAGLVGLCGLVGLLKPIDGLLCLSVLLVPGRLFAGAGRAWGFRGLAIGTGLALAVLWNLSYPFVPGRYWHTGADPAAAIRLLLHAPLQGLDVLLRNAWWGRWFWWVDGWGRFGGGPGPYHFTVPALLPGLALAVLLATLLTGSPGGPRPHYPAACLLLLLSAGLLALLLLAFRIGYGPPAAAFIDGVQGRYMLLPELLLLLGVRLALPGGVRPAGRGRIRLVLLTGSWLALVLATLDIALGHWAALWH